MQQVGTRPEIGRRAMQSPAPHPVLETTLATLGASGLAESTCPCEAAFAEIERITSIYGKLASVSAAQVEDMHSRIVAPDRTGSLPPACWPPSGRIGGSARAVEVRDMVAHAAELNTLDGPYRHRASAAGLSTHAERGGLGA